MESHKKQKILHQTTIYCRILPPPPALTKSTPTAKNATPEEQLCAYYIKEYDHHLSMAMPIKPYTVLIDMA